MQRRFTEQASDLIAGRSTECVKEQRVRRAFELGSQMTPHVLEVVCSIVRISLCPPCISCWKKYLVVLLQSLDRCKSGLVALHS